MTFEILFRAEAEIDIRRVFDWYQDQSHGLGPRFVVKLDDAFKRIQDNPKIYEDLHKGVRRVIVRGFPVGVFFKIVGESVQVIAVEPMARDPKRWIDRA